MRWNSFGPKIWGWLEVGLPVLRSRDRREICAITLFRERERCLTLYLTEVCKSDVQMNWMKGYMAANGFQDPKGDCVLLFCLCKAINYILYTMKQWFLAASVFERHPQFFFV